MFGRTVSDIHNLESRLDGFPGTLQEVFCQRSAPPFVKSTFNFGFSPYNAPGIIDDKMAPSEKIKELIKEFNDLSSEVISYKLPQKSILSKIIDHMFYVMLEGVHQLVLDTHFFLKICGSLISKGANRLANKVCEKALRIYFASNTNNENQMMGRPWYDSQVKKAIDALETGILL
ncbi:hypothetical protein AYI68_g4318 [Smittium mucronatum]|uniref:Uncharacterized protein n=1 Tax=Smittium mucronatum TaxID=133383 RepID=A0A1R0GXE8_9FUNG|nr:hypothetical protein AYI68_g4318 [Smittium mucronatum]